METDLKGFTREKTNRKKRIHRTMLQNISFQKCLDSKILTFKPSAIISPRSVRYRLTTRKYITRGFYKSRLIRAIPYSAQLKHESLMETSLDVDI